MTGVAPAAIVFFEQGAQELGRDDAALQERRRGDVIPEKLAQGTAEPVGSGARSYEGSTAHMPNTAAWPKSRTTRGAAIAVRSLVGRIAVPAAGWCSRRRVRRRHRR